MRAGKMLKLLYPMISLLLSQNKLLIHLFGRTKLAHGMLSGKYSIPAAKVNYVHLGILYAFSFFLEITICCS